MRNIKTVIAYEGTDFHGWQVQPGRRTIQGEIEGALALIEGAAVKVHGSGRTDAGVHARGQAASFRISNPIPVENLRLALNHRLPPAIRILDASEAVALGHVLDQARAVRPEPVEAPPRDRQDDHEQRGRQCRRPSRRGPS